MLGTVLHVLMKMIYEEDENDFVKNFWLITDKWNLIGTMIVLAWYVVRTSLSKVRWDKMIIRWHSGHFLVVLYTQFYMKWHCLSELNSTENLKKTVFCPSLASRETAVCIIFSLSLCLNILQLRTDNVPVNTAMADNNRD